MKITEGYMPFKEYKTYYRIVGECIGDKKPIVLLHGGPGSTHNYFEVLDNVAEDGRAVIMYDQLGCGNSFVANRPDLWTAETWVEELIALRKHLGLDEIHLLGQSWGGMQLLEYLCNYKPDGIKSAVLSSTLPASCMWEKEQRRHLTYFPQEMQDAIAKAEAAGNYDDPDYLAGVDKFMERYCAGIPDEHSPECLRRPKKSGTEAYITAWGQSEFAPSGTLKNYDVREQLKDIQEPCLVMSGLLDLCTPWIAKFMYDRIPNSKWELFEFSRHMCFVEEHDKYVKILNEWLNAHD
ncbi:MAG: proline iminopeptidase-family hydrolase [Lachnospiraceae bacterium]